MPDSPLTGAEVLTEIRKRTSTILLAFSCGKDSIATWLACRKIFPRILPYYMYLIPGLGFIERSLSYYEDWFGRRILRVPHPSLYRMLNNLVFTPPERCRVIERLRLPRISYSSIQEEIREHSGLGSDCYTASGVRAADSPIRLLALRKYGAINHRAKQFFPIWDWKKADMLATIRDSGVQLPIDYRLFGRSFDGIDYRFLAPIQRAYPEDYAKILDWFPLADIEIARRDFAKI